MRTQRRVSIRCVRRSSASPTACSARSPMPRTWCRKAFIRWMAADRAAVREPEAFLRRTVTRLCLDQLKSARHRRETYVGPWLPEPVVEEEDADDDVTLPLMLALGTAVAARARRLPAARRVRAGLRRGRGDDRARRRRLPPACRPGAHPCPRGAAALPGGQAARAGARQRLLRGLAQRRHERARRACWPPMSASIPTAAASAPPRLHADSRLRRRCSRCTRRWPIAFRQAWLDARARRLRSTACPASSRREADGEVQTTALRDRGRHGSRRSMSMRNPDKLKRWH